MIEKTIPAERLAASRALRRYLKDTGWSAAKFRRVCGVDKSALSKFLSGERAVSVATAISIERTLRALHESGDVAVAPLLAIDLSPRLAEIRDVAEPAKKAG